MPSHSPIPRSSILLKLRILVSNFWFSICFLLLLFFVLWIVVVCSFLSLPLFVYLFPIYSLALFYVAGLVILGGPSEGENEGQWYKRLEALALGQGLPARSFHLVVSSL